MPESKEEITPEVFNHLVDLAELALDEKESEYLRRELNNQLSSIHELEAIALDEDILPASHGVPYPLERKPALRGDEWRPSEAAKDIIELNRIDARLSAKDDFEEIAL